MQTLQLSKVPLFSVRALTGVNQGDIPLLLLHLLVQFPHLKSQDHDSQPEQGYLTSPDALAKSMEWRSPSSVIASSSSRSHMMVSRVSSGALNITRLSSRCSGFVQSHDSKSLRLNLGTCNTCRTPRKKTERKFGNI